MNQQTATSEDETAVAAVQRGKIRKPYLRPEFLRLGTLADITRTVGYRGAADGGRFPQRFRTGTLLMRRERALRGGNGRSGE